MASSPLRVFWVVNVGAANGRTGAEWANIIYPRLVKLEVDLKHEETRYPGHATELTRAALDQQAYDVIVSVGGDGTHNEVINGFFTESGVAIPTTTKLTFLSRGTGGDLCRTLEIPTDFEEFFDVLYNGDDMPCDIGEVTCASYTTESKEVRRFYINECSYGVSAAVARKVNEGSRSCGHSVAYVLGTVRALAQWRNQMVKMTVDGEEVGEFNLLFGTASNGCYFGGGMKVAPLARPNDGRLDFTVIDDLGLCGVAANFNKLYNGAIYEHRRVLHFAGQTLTVEPLNKDAVVSVECDGELPGKLPMRVRVLPAAVTLKVPRLP